MKQIIVKKECGRYKKKMVYKRSEKKRKKKKKEYGGYTLMPRG